MPASPKRPALTPHSDPVRYANRPLDADFDEYRAVREHVARLVIQPVNQPPPACPAA